MKTLLSILSMILIASTGWAQSASITVNVEDLRSDDGKVLIQVQNEEEEVVTQQMATISEGKITVLFSALPHGTYAISYYHDENNDGELNTGMMGIPKEGYGFSNDARGFMGPPSLEDQLFALKSDTSMTLKTKYW